MASCVSFYYMVWITPKNIRGRGRLTKVLYRDKKIYSTSKIMLVERKQV